MHIFANCESDRARSHPILRTSHFLPSQGQMDYGETTIKTLLVGIPHARLKLGNPLNSFRGATILRGSVKPEST